MENNTELIQFTMMSNDDRLLKIGEIVKSGFFSNAIYTWNLPDVSQYYSFVEWLEAVNINRVFSSSDLAYKLLKFASSDDIKFYFYKEFKNLYIEKYNEYLREHPETTEENK